MVVLSDAFLVWQDRPNDVSIINCSDAALSVYLSVCLPACLFVCLSVCL
jgi:hypothetical protein